jgi:myo-inositol-1(or 4)-monophosphatase
MQKNQFLEAALGAVKKAEPVFLKHFGRPAGVAVKGGHFPSLVSDVDKEIEKIIFTELLEKFPLHAIVGEEHDPHTASSPYTWYIDPIDGPTNFIRGLSPCVISVALFDEQGPLVGVISAPNENILYRAVPGEGAFKNDKKMRVSDSSEFNMLVGGLGWKGADTGAELFRKMSTAVRTMRTFGSDALHLALVAEGKLDCYATNITSLYDVAAGLLLVTEAGGKATDWNGEAFTKNQQSLVVSNGVIHEVLLKIISLKD